MNATTVRRAADRGQFDYGWLQTSHTFSFGRYYDAEQMGFHSLRVMNEDRVAPGKGFGTHRHEDMEIISIVLDGQLEHRDSLGNGAVLEVGDVQYMSAGNGIEHSEFNPSSSKDSHFYQIWIEPTEVGLKPAYGQTKLDRERIGWQTLATGDDESGAPIRIRQNARIEFGRFARDAEAQISVAGRDAFWLQVLSGEIRFANENLIAGDGLAVESRAEAVDDSLAVLSDEAEVLAFTLGN